MVASIAVVFGLAYLDLQRDQSRALADFGSEQHTLAAAGATIVSNQKGAMSASDPRLFAGLAPPEASLEQKPLVWLLMDSDGRSVRFEPGDATPVGAFSFDRRDLPRDLGALKFRLEARESGSLLLDREAAESLGLPRRAAMAGFAPVVLHDGKPASIAVVTSAKRVRDRARIGTLRLVVTTSMAALVVGLFGWLGIRQQQKTLELKRALEIAEATAALRESLGRAEKLGTIGTLAAGMAHEIGTPLGIISGRAEQLLAKIPPGEEGDAARKSLSSILGQVDKVSTTIRQLLDFARVRPVEAKALSPSQLIESAGALLEHRFRQAKVHFSSDIPTTLPAINGDSAQLEQLFVNLLLNATDACEANGTIEAHATPRDQRIVFEIRDDGCGIAPEHLASVTDPFFTTKKRGQGTGLGLSIVADIVKNHGGTLAIDSKVGMGTTVRVELPIATATTSGAHTGAPA